MKILFGSRQQGMSPTHSPISGMQEMQGTYTQLSGPHPRGTQEEHKSYISNMAKRHPSFFFSFCFYQSWHLSIISRTISGGIGYLL